MEPYKSIGQRKVYWCACCPRSTSHPGVCGRPSQTVWETSTNTFLPRPQCNAQGVTIVLNREMTNIHDVKQQDVIPGRAMLLTLPWHSDLTLTILNVYAPNAHSENQQFWETLETKWVDMNLPFPDIMLGDFNLVEDAIN